jgi:PleD family two-component response regulator
VAERLNQAIRDLNIPHEKSGVASYVSISIGICSGIPSAGENMLLKADEALYTSKHDGRNRWSSVSLEE